MGDDMAKIRRFGPFELDLEQRLLLRAGESVPLTPKAFDTLAVLVERQGKIVDKTELLKLVPPFINLTGHPEDDYFGDGLTEELTNSIAHLEGLRVIARTTAFQFKGKALDIRSIAEQLHVHAVLEGSVQRQEKKLRVTVQLNDAQSGYHIWSQTYDRDAVDLFSIQEDISNQVAHTLRPNSPATRAPGRITDRDAYNLYLLGRFHRSRPDEASIRKAMGFFEQAIEKDAAYAAAYAGLAECYMKLALGNFMPPVDAWPAAQKVLDKALALDDNLSEAHSGTQRK
jgi:TolB-like protein